MCIRDSFQVDDMSRGIITLLAAMPTGANAFLFATKLDRAVDSTSGAVALGSLLTVLTASLLVSALHAP
jgi:predicted permease